MQPDFELRHLFPGRIAGESLSRQEIERIADFWDDNESIELNLAAINHWIDRLGNYEDGA